ncbi:MAG TPA: magnesium transporter CorA family protein [Paracoccus sp. (in: a-proteobacteria)]|mgnify:CR=1 FL=1|nr:magnesium transporter CorA family protein [Paracoccus sp. (in: a-proteobacteria)]
MLYAYQSRGAGIGPMTPEQPLTGALWIDLYRPLDRQVNEVEALGFKIPTLADMEEIEISNRLYREGDSLYMTAVLPGSLPDGRQTAMPVTFILSPARLVTVRHHAPRPFETFPSRADRSTIGADTPDRLFLALIDEIVARQADLMESAGHALEEVSARIFNGAASADAGWLQTALERTGREAERLSRIRLALLTIERMLAFHSVSIDPNPGAAELKPVLKAIQRDIQALEVHGGFLSSRVGLIVNATLGMINLQQNSTVRILSVIAALLLPPTLIASIYGMNFDHMPELHARYGYAAALGLMALSALGTWMILRWKRWL